MPLTTVTVAPWGATSTGASVEEYTLSNGRLTLRMITYGARVTAILVPDREGRLADVALAWPDMQSYESETAYIGATIGRFANRIAKGRFALGNEAVQVPVNDGPNSLHSGPQGFDTRVWAAEIVEGGVEFHYRSPAGEMGFPGELDVCARYTVVDTAIHIEYTATTDALTVVNLTNHTYFNLTGQPGTVLDHELMLPADRFTPTDETAIPTGQLASVADSPFDFREPRRIGSAMSADHQQLAFAHGFDHNWVLADAPRATPELTAELHEPFSGRTLTVRSTEPGVQFYSGNYLDGTRRGKHGQAYQKHAGLCLETQHFPDAPNHPEWPSVLLQAGQTFRSRTEFVFGVRAAAE
jgi:aldose 1-epimerase